LASPLSRGEGEESTGGVRVAMEDDENVRYFVTDHLGSTTKLINTDGSEYSEMDYLAWGSDNLTPPDIGTSFKYTGQRQAEAGLYFYNARWYDPKIGRFIQADSIIPEPGNPQAWDRYAYANNNPLYYTDPSGHYSTINSSGGCSNTKDCPRDTDTERRAIIYSRMFPGSGKDNTWTHKDWEYYISNMTDLWTGGKEWYINGAEYGWDLFAQHVGKLASFYSDDEKDLFVRDFGLAFAGISYKKDLDDALWDARNGPTGDMYIRELNDGLNEQYFESANGIIEPADNQSHHYAGLFVLSYFQKEVVSHFIGYVRDPNNVGDIVLGNIAINDASRFRQTTTIGDLAKYISELKH
jgi:RHS repeat-associated protein